MSSLLSWHSDSDRAPPDCSCVAEVLATMNLVKRYAIAQPALL
jgi:hypothetical protein